MVSILLIIGIVLAITLSLTIGRNGTTTKPITPSHNSVTFQRDIDGNEELSEFNSLRNYYDEFEADVHGQISWGLFDKNGDLIEEESIEGISTLRDIDTIVTYYLFWDSYYIGEMDDESEYSKLSFDVCEYEHIYTKSSEESIDNSYIENMEKIQMGDSWHWQGNIDEFKESFHEWDGGYYNEYQETEKNDKYTDYSNPEYSYYNEGYYENSDGVIEDKYIDFDYYDTYYMN